VSPFRYAWEALVVNELTPLSLTFKADGLPPVPNVSGTLFLSLLGVKTSVGGCQPASQSGPAWKML
jgi:hypothetical protein